MTSSRFPTRTGKANPELLREGMNRLPSVLAELGYTSLRKGQDRSVYNLLGQVDTLCILPTGSGKSLTFIVPTVVHNWKTLIFCPLVSLMRDQVKSALSKGVSAAQLSSTQTEGQNIDVMKQWAEGKLQMLYVAPERLSNPMFKAALHVQPPDFVVLDEAHTLSQWSDNFRPSYKDVGDFIREYDPKVVGAFTATCPEEVEQDIRWVLGLANASKVCYYPRRENLIMSSSKLESDLQLVTRLKKAKGSCIVYCSTIKRLEDLVYSTQQLMGEPVTYFHGQLPPEVKKANQDAFMAGKIRIIFATNAFGMGIDKGDVENVFMRDIPGSIEELAQALGRGGRNGCICSCHTFLSEDSIRTQEFFIRMGHPAIEDISAVYDAMDSMADSSGTVHEGLGKIAKLAGVNPMMMGPIMNILKSDKVTERSSDKSTVATIKYHKFNKSDPRFMKWYDTIQQGGVEVGGNAVEVDFEWLYKSLNYTSGVTVKKWLRQWEYEGYLTFEPPPAYPPIEIIGGLDRIDFKRLRRRAKEAQLKLKDVLQYCHIADADKHAFIESKFGVTPPIEDD